MYTLVYCILLAHVRCSTGPLGDQPIYTLSTCTYAIRMTQDLRVWGAICVKTANSLYIYICVLTFINNYVLTYGPTYINVMAYLYMCTNIYKCMLTYMILEPHI